MTSVTNKSIYDSCKNLAEKDMIVKENKTVIFKNKKTIKIVISNKKAMNKRGFSKDLF